MSNLDDKLLIAYDNNDVVKIKKYLNYGADPHVNNSILFYGSIFNNRYDVLQVLSAHDTSQKDMHQIVRYACLNNKPDCLKVLLKNIDLDEYKQTDTIDYIHELVDVCY